MRMFSRDTSSHVFLSRWTGLHCRADRIARRDEKFFKIRHSWAKRLILKPTVNKQSDKWRVCHVIRLTLATWIQCSRIRALWENLSVRSLRQVEMTQLVTRLNWLTVALMVGARCSFPFLSLWDQMLPKQWYGTTRLNSSCTTTQSYSFQRKHESFSENEKHWAIPVLFTYRPEDQMCETQACSCLCVCVLLTASIRVNCSATTVGSKLRKSGRSSSNPFSSSRVNAQQPWSNTAERKTLFC